MEVVNLETQMNYITRDHKECIMAYIRCTATEDPHEPVELVITSPTNLLLYFQTRISSQMALEMAARLLMEPLKPE